jgi:hypothetical protein
MVQKTGIVPYNRVTNIDITQGPISRILGIATLKIQTAGYSGQQARAEIRIEGMEQFEELRELIMGFVKGKKPVAIETHEEDIELKILSELVKIRKLLEKSLGKWMRYTLGGSLRLPNCSTRATSHTCNRYTQLASG